MGAHRVVPVAVVTLLTLGCGDDGAVPSAGSSSSGMVASSVDQSTGSAPTECPAGEVRACYEGPLGTADIGRCRSGQQTCAADGSQWSACEGEVWPAEFEDCQTPEDDDCSGAATCSPALEWAHTLPGFVTRLRSGPDGNIVATGYGNGATVELELFGVFVLGLDPSGEVLWHHNVQAADVQIQGLAIGPDGSVTVTGYYIGVADFGGEPLPPSSGLDAFAVRYAPDGTFEWGQTLSTQGYHAVAVGADGTTYVTGGDVTLEVDGEFEQGRFFVSAIDPSGEVQWTTLGHGGYLLSGYSSIGFAEDDELLVAMSIEGLLDITPDLGGVPLQAGRPGPIAIWMDRDGAVIRSVPFTDEPTVGSGRVWVSGRPQGVVAVADVAQSIDGDYTSTVLVSAFDGAGRRQSSTFIGSDVELVRADLHPWGGLLLGLEFQGSLELGSIGVVQNGYERGYAMTVVDDHGQGQWVEVLYGHGPTMITASAAVTDGGVLVAGEVPGSGTLAGETVAGTFIAKLRP